MKKILCSFLLIILLLSLASCNKDLNTNYSEYHLYQAMINGSSYYEINTKEELVAFNESYFHNDDIYEKYNEQYFLNNTLFVFLISESSGGNRHKLYDSYINKDGTLVVNCKRTNEGMTCDMAYWVVFYELENESAKKVQKIELQSKNHTLSYTNIEKFETSYPVDISDDTRLFISWYNGISFSYDSRNNELFQSSKNKVAYNLSEERFNEIYQVLRDVKLDSYPEVIYASDKGEYEISVFLDSGEIRSSCHIREIPSFDVSTWEHHQELGITLINILNDYIENSTEYQTLLSNMNE